MSQFYYREIVRSSISLFIRRQGGENKVNNTDTDTDTNVMSKRDKNNQSKQTMNNINSHDEKPQTPKNHLIENIF